MNTLKKVKWLAWHLTHPYAYPQLARRVVRTLSGRAKAEREAMAATVRWCEAHAVSLNDALVKLVGTHDAPRFSATHTAWIDEQYRRVQNLPVKSGAGSLDLLYAVAESLGATRAIETGVAYGWSSAALLTSLASRSGRLVSNDMPYAYQGSEDIVGLVVPESLRPNWTLLRHPDSAGLPKALEILPVIDLCHYDSDKTYEGRRWAYPLLWRALRPGGVLISDDIDNNMGFMDFCKSVGREPVVIAEKAEKRNKKYVGAIVK